MIIALICDRWDHQGDGLELWAWRFVAEMGRRGHSMHVVTLDVRSPANGATLHPIQAGRSKLARAGAVETAVRGLGADIVHDTGVGWTYDVIHPQAGSRMANDHRDIASRPWPQRWLRQLRPARWAWRRNVRELEHRQYQQSDGIVLAVSNKWAKPPAIMSAPTICTPTRSPTS